MSDVLDLPRQSVLVLGAAGFIGSHLVAALTAKPAYRAIAASRTSRSAVVETREVDATNLKSMQAALYDVDYVVNCVAGSSQTMISATQTLCDAARAKPPRRIIHLSSMAVYGEATGRVREDQIAVGRLSSYGKAKFQCEQILLKYGHDGGRATILRPTCVFGPGSQQWTTRVGRLLLARRLGDLGPAGDGYCNLAFVDDLVTGITRALCTPDTSNPIYNVSGDTGMTWNQFLVCFAKALGATPVSRISPRTLRLESRMLAPIRRLAEIGLSRVGVRTTLTDAITPSLLALMAQDIRIDCSAAVNALSLPQTPVEQMIASASGWLCGKTQPTTDSHGLTEAFSA